MIDQLSDDFVAAYANWLGVTEGEAYQLLKDEPLVDVTDELTAAAWDESKHRREPSGTEKGGEFAPKDSGELPDPDHWKGPVTEGEEVTGKIGDPIPIGGAKPVTMEELAARLEREAEEGRERARARGELAPKLPTEPLGSDRDSHWEGDPIEPKSTRFGGVEYDAVANSESVWNGRENPDMPYSIDKDYYLYALDATDDDADLDASLAAYRDEVEDRMRDIGEEGELRIQTPFDVMGEIIEDGRFKSQFEVPYSQGAFLPNVRAAQEEMFFGYPQDMPPDRRPIYGWLEHPDAENQMGVIPQYGEITWALKPGVKARTTVTFTDSLSRPVVPGPIMNPGWRATVPPGYTDSGMGSEITDHRFETGLFDDVIETQYHGGVTLDDVQSVRITVASYGSWSDADRAKAKSYAADLRESGIVVNFEDENGDPLDDNGEPYR